MSANAESAPALRPLPARPSLEFERKAAKKLLAALRIRDASALSRAHAHSVNRDEYKLSDAQFVIAREYGFLSWTRLVQYMQALARQMFAPTAAEYPIEQHDQQAQGLLRAHKAGRRQFAMGFAAYVPRFFGKSVEDVLASPVTIDDARLVIARGQHAPSWAALVERSGHSEERMTSSWEWFESDYVRACDAMKREDYARLAELIARSPELVAVQPLTSKVSRSLLKLSLTEEFHGTRESARRTSDWLVEHGADLVETLNRMITNGYYRDPERNGPRAYVDYLKFLETRGANLGWVSPNGFSALEHVLVRGWMLQPSSDGAEYIAQRTQPRRALWVAAGLGDLKTMASFFDRNGTLTADARKHRPDFNAIGPFGGALLPEVSDAEVLFEAYVVAMMSKRVNAMEFLLDRGIPLDYPGWGQPLANFAVHASMELRDVAMFEMLVRRGASLDTKGYMPEATAREIAAEMYNYKRNDPIAQRLIELCGLTPEQIPLPPPRQPGPPSPRALELIEIAKAEAARCGQQATERHNLFIALLRDTWFSSTLGLLKSCGIDLTALRASVRERLDAPLDLTATVPLSADAQAVLERAAAHAHEHNSHPMFDVLFLLGEPGTPVATEFIERFGGDPAKLYARLERATSL